MKTHFKKEITHAFFVCFISTVICCSLLVFGISLPSIYQSNLNAKEELTSQSMSRIEDYLDQINSLCIQISYNVSTRAILEKKYNGDISERTEYMNDSSMMSQLYQDFLQAFTDVDGIFIYNQYDYPYYFVNVDKVNRYYSIARENWYQYLSRQTDYKAKVYSGIHMAPQLRGSAMWISLYRNIRDLDKHQIIGKAELMIRPKAFQKLLNISQERSKNEQELTLVDSSGRVICSTDKKYEAGDVYDKDYFNRIRTQQQITFHDSATIFHALYSSNSGWYLVNEFESATLFSDMKIILICFIGFIALTLMIVSIWGNHIAQQATQPIRILSLGISNIKHQKFDQKITINSNDEFQDLADAFNQMTDSINSYIQQIQQIEKEKVEAEMTALQAQINPHFTLNTITSVKHMAMLSGSTNIVQMLNDFSLLLAAAFRVPNELITMREELDRVKAFFRIQTVSYFNKIRFNIQCEQEALDYFTLPLILQPIAENAIFHGIKPKMSSHQMIIGNVNISINALNSDLEIHVIDDGIGMTEETISQVLSSSKSGIGVKNVNARIRLRFGENYGLSIESAPDKGCDVKIRIPIITKTQMEESTT